MLVSGSVTVSVYKEKSTTCLQGGPRADRYKWGEITSISKWSEITPGTHFL